MAIISVTGYDKMYRNLILEIGEKHMAMEDARWYEDEPAGNNVSTTPAQAAVLGSLSGGDFTIQIAEDGTMTIETRPSRWGSR